MQEKYKSNIDDNSLLFLIKIKNLYNRLLFYKFDKFISNTQNEQQDLNLEKKIKEINADKYIEKFVKDLNNQYKIKGNTVFEVGSDLNLKTAQLFLVYGAKSVVCTNPKFPDDLTSPDKRITIVKELGENVDTKNEKFDIVFGIALIEHVHDIKGLFEKIRDILKPNGFAFLQGNPLYCCACGHHVYINSDFAFDKRLGKTNPFEPWEHLMYDKKEDVEKLFIKKGFPEDIIKKMIGQYFISGHINKYRTKDIIKAIKSVSKLKTVIMFEKEAEYEPNEFYNKASKKYTKEELMSRGMIVYARRK